MQNVYLYLVQIARLVAEAIYTNSAHHFLTDPDKITKETHQITGAVAWW